MNTINLPELASTINNATKYVYQKNVEAGWWKDLEYERRNAVLIEMGLPYEKIKMIEEVFNSKPEKDRDPLSLLMLIVTEIAEAAEGVRKDLMDDKLPHRKMLEVELADAQIRIWDLAGKENLDLGGAIVEKLAYNASREDHKLENRMKANGKKS